MRTASGVGGGVGHAAGMEALMGRLLVALVACAAPATLAAEAWSEFRGPSGDGVSRERGLPVEWSETDGVAWKTPIAGKAWSSPVIADGVVWMTNATEDGTRLSAVAVAADSGRVIHDLTLFEPTEPAFCHDFNSHASCTPVLENHRLYAHFGSAGTACIDTDTGAVLWKQEELRCDHHRGPGSSPIIHGNLLIVPFDGFDVQYVAAMETQSGRVVWKRDRGIDYGSDDGDAKKAYGTGTVIEANGRPQVIIPSAGATIAYAPATGEEIWRVNHGGMNASARPLHGNGLVYLNTGAGGMKMLAVRPDGTGDVTGSGVAWTSPKGSGCRASQVLVGDRLFHIGNAGTATVLDAITGEAVWQKRLGGEFSSSPILADGRIYCPNQEGQTFVVSAAAPYEVIVTNTLDEGCMASPAAYDRALFLRTTGHLYKLVRRP